VCVHLAADIPAPLRNISRNGGFSEGKVEGPMRRHFLTRTAMVGSLLALAACADADTIGGKDTNAFVTTARSTPDAEPGNGKAWIFGAPREARVLFW